MIRVRQSADDFLANLVQNIQVPENGRRQRRPQHEIVAESSHAAPGQRGPAKRPQKEPAKTKQAARKPPIKPSATRAPVPGKPSRKPAQSSKKQPKQAPNPAPIPQYLADNIEVIEAAEQVQPVPNLPQNSISCNTQPQVESVGQPVNQNDNRLSNNFQQSQYQSQSFPVPPHTQSGNFYEKNRSNIFMQDPVSSHPNRQQAQYQGQQQVLDHALKIAAQQPLPASPRTWQREHAVLDPITEASNSLQNISQPATHLNHHSTQQFSIGGAYTNSGLTQKEIERQKWIKDLEAQVAEKKRRLEAEKEKYSGRSPAPINQHNQQHPNPVLRSSFDHQPTHYTPPVVETVYQQPQQAAQQAAQQAQYKEHPNPVLRSSIFGGLDQHVSYPTKPQYQPPPQIQQPQIQQPQIQQPPQLHVQSPTHFQQSPHALAQHPNPVLRSTIFSDSASPRPQYQQQVAQPQEMMYQQSTNLAPRPELETPTRGNLLGQNSMVDPLEMERRTSARQKALEHQNSLREQVAEKERKKQEKERLVAEEEAADRRRFEEEKRRLEEEKREELARNIKLEQEKQEKVLEISRQMEESKRAAKLEKQRKRDQATNDPKPVKQESPEVYTQWAQSTESQAKTQGKMVHSPVPVRQPVQASSSLQVTEPTPTPQQLPHHLSHHLPHQLPHQLPQQQQMGLVRYISEAGTQTVCEMSCQTSPEPLHDFNRAQITSPGALHSESKLISISRETSHLMSDTAMLRLKTRELSTVQREDHGGDHGGDKKRSRIPERTKLPAKKGPSIPVRGKKDKTVKKVVEDKKAPAYDKNGRRIRAEDDRRKGEEIMKPQREPQKGPESKLFTARESSLVIEQYQPVSELFQPTPAAPSAKPRVVEQSTVQDEMKWWNNTPSDLHSEVITAASVTPATSHATPSHATPSHATPSHAAAATPSFTLHADQIQLKYSSPNTDNGYIPSAISSRQNDILGQLAQLRLGLQNRRRVISTTAAEMKV